MPPIYIINFAHALYLLQVLFNVQKSGLSWTLWKSGTMSQFISTKIWKRYDIHFGVYGGNSSMNIHSGFVSIWRHCGGYEKNWMNPMVITNGQQLRSFTLIILIRKELRSFLWHPRYNRQRNKLVNQIHIQRDGCAWLTYQAGSS